VALVVGADTTPKGFLKPNAGERNDDPDWLRFRLLGATNPGYFAMWARRRIDLYGATADDFAQVKVKNARHGLANPYARYRKEVTPADVAASPVVASPLRLLDICATSDGGAAVVISSMDFARRHLAGSTDGLVRIAAVSTVTPTFPNTVLELPNFATDSAAGLPVPDLTFKQAIGAAAYEQAGLGPDDVDVAEVYDLSTALELD
jgi:acetyl-CoA acetyltransferase